MFLGGADPRMAPELRVPSLKAMLRFWWRALAWPRFLVENDYDQNLAFQGLSRYEDDLFGSTRTGQSRFLMQANWANRNGNADKFVSVSDWPPNSPYGSGYLGYGITKSRVLPHQVGIYEKTEFEIQCVFRPTREQNLQTIPCWKSEITTALQALGLFGGLGSRSRRGFGSVHLSKLDDQPVAIPNINSLKKQIGMLLPKRERVELPPFTSFSRHARIVLFQPASQSAARQAHKELGDSYRNFRGQPGQLRGATKRPLGLPLAGVDTDRRRASPVFMHIHPVEQSHVGIVTFLPAVFHPQYPQGNVPEFYSIIHEWLNQLEIVA
jgi:CRISPR-associated protein Cmr1